jgi:ubiquinone/menaquinone biosynthesis C-methylase UbiE
MMSDAAMVSRPQKSQAATEQALGLFTEPLAEDTVDLSRGYLDLLGEEDPTGTHPAQRLMVSRVLPLIYERFWRPLGGRLLMGISGPGAEEELRMALAMLSIEPGDRVLDVACGPGNFTRAFAQAANEGIVVGLDASASMLEVAVRETEEVNVAYMRGDARALPFCDGSFDAICCFAALYLIEEPMRALAEIVRVLAPGGRLALLASCNRGLLPAGAASAVVHGLSGVRVFGREELTAALTKDGMVEVDQRVAGLAQFISGRKPEVT